MTTPWQIRAVAVVSVLIVLGTGCAPRVGAADPEPDVGGSDGDDEVVLRVDRTAGLTTYAALATSFPVVVVYGDGRVITEGLMDPSRPLPNPRQRDISPADVQVLVDRALAAGVGQAVDIGVHPADGISHQFTVLTQTGYRRSTVHALTGRADGQPTARTALRELLGDLTDLPASLGEDSVSQESRYLPTALAAVAEPWGSSSHRDDESPEVAWPGPELPGEVLDPGVGLHCVTVTGTEATTDVLAAAAEAEVSTPWVAGGERWLISLRPLLPHEANCADLDHRAVSQHDW